MHGHIDAWREGRAELGGILALANGITTIRDLAADVDRAVSFRDRAAAGTLISPRILLAGFMDGPGRGAGPTDAIVSTEDEAIEWVARYDSLGYRQIKVYGLVHPILVATIAEEAKKRGMRLSGHVPVGLSATDVVRLGFNEIQHLNILMNNFFPDSMLVVQLKARAGGERPDPSTTVPAPHRGCRRSGGDPSDRVPARSRHCDRWDAQPVRGPRKPPRGWNGSGSRADAGLASAHRPARVHRRATPPQIAAMRRLQRAKYHGLLKRLFDAGVTIVPGTDNPAFAYAAELEIYERAGIPAPEVLRIATLVPAQVMNEERDYGSIEPGKVADIIIVDGDPATRIRDLRKVETVVRAGRVYSVRDLYAEVGVTPTW
jgi:hypothetical protein